MKSAFDCSVLATLFASLIVTGCAAPTQKLSAEERSKIDMVQVNKRVQKPAGMYYLGPSVAPVLFGSVGLLAAQASQMDDAKVLLEYAERNGVFVEQIAHQEVEAALRESGKLKVSDTARAGETVMNVLVYQYGFSIPTGFSSRLVPMLGIRCELADPTGRVLWRGTERVLPLGNPVDSIALEDLRKDPKRIEDAWRRAARHIAKTIFDEM
jgi:hypothetical protein